MQWLVAHATQLVVAVLAILEIISVFVPGATGTLGGLIKVLKDVPGVKDPGIGQ